jgi:peptide/nickel transport system permease protein
MTGYVLKRILLVIPTMLVVMIIAFFLSKLVPGDAASAMLILQGIQPDGPNASKEYERNYIHLKLNKPTFYFSILPDFYPENINQIPSDTKRKQINDFLIQKFKYSDIQDYLSVRDQIIFAKSSDNKDSLDNNDTSNLIFETQPAKIKSSIEQLLKYNNAEISPKISALETSFNKMVKNKANFYYPKIFWHGLDNQFHFWFKEIIAGNFGLSIKDGRMVSDKISAALKWTLVLILLNVILSSLISIPTGLYAGYKENGWFDRMSSFISLLLYATPVFWLASLLIVFCTSDRYSTFLNIFPTPGTWYIPDNQSFFRSMGLFSGQLVLPIICLVANDIAQLSRITKNNVIEQKSKLYVTLAKAKGLNDWVILKKHILPNVLIPLITVIGGRIPAGISGALIIEIIFNIPGMGRLMYESIFSSDWNVVFGILLIVSVFTITFMLITDIIYAVVNPKIKTSMS